MFLKSAINRGQHFSSASAGVDGILKLMSYSRSETKILVEKRKVVSLFVEVSWKKGVLGRLVSLKSFDAVVYM
jgi:hypothetical protein